MKTVTEEFVRRNQNIRHYSVRQAIEAETARRLGLDQLDEFSTGSTHGGTVAAIGAGASTLLGSSNKKKLNREGGKFGAGQDHRNVYTDVNPGEARGYSKPDAYKNVKGTRSHPVDISQGERLAHLTKKPTKELGRTSTAYTPDQTKGLRGGQRADHPNAQASDDRVRAGQVDRGNITPKRKHVGTSTSPVGEDSFADSNPLPGAPRYGHDEPDENYPPEDENFFEPDERQYDKAVQFIDWLMNPSNQAAKKYLNAFRDPGANAMDLGREIYGNMSPELQREYDIDTLIDAIEDKLAEVGMRPKESNIEPFSQYFNEDDKDKDSQDKKPPVDPDSASKRHHARKSAERGEAAKKRRPKSHGSFDEPSFGKDYD
jgi:hypothetical protein